MHHNNKQIVSYNLKLNDMKKTNILKGLMTIVALFFVNLTISSGNPADNLIYNSEEVNGVVVSETIYKKSDNTLNNYMKHNYKYDAKNQKIEDEALKWDGISNKWEKDLCIRYTYSGKSYTAQYYKWNKKSGYVLVPEMTITIEQ